MRILRYPLEIVEYQQLQPLWPGRVLAVAPGRLSLAEHTSVNDQKIDLWAVENEAKQGDRRAPVLGVWVIGTGWELPAELLEQDALYHGTCVMANELVWHVWSAIVAEAAQAPTPMGEVGSYADIVSKVRARHQREIGGGRR